MRHQPGRCRIKQRRIKPGALHRPGKDHAGHTLIRQVIQKRHQPLDTEGQIGHQPIGRKPFQRCHKGGLKGRRHYGRQPAAPGDDGDAPGPGHFGVRKERSELDRMKSVISRTWVLSVSSASLRARSRKVPSPCASIW